jgi:hypothetical protein
MKNPVNGEGKRQKGEIDFCLLPSAFSLVGDRFR